MPCLEKCCIYPPRSNGYCVNHQWRVESFTGQNSRAAKVESSLDGRERPSHNVVQAKPSDPPPSASFKFTKPRITVEPSQIYSGKFVWTWYLPSGLTEPGGSVNFVIRKVTIENYLARLSELGLHFMPSEVRVDDIPAEALLPEKQPEAKPQAKPEAKPEDIAGGVGITVGRVRDCLKISEVAMTCVQIADKTGMHTSIVGFALRNSPIFSVVGIDGRGIKKPKLWSLLESPAPIPPEAMSQSTDKKRDIDIVLQHIADGFNTSAEIESKTGLPHGSVTSHISILAKAGKIHNYRMVGARKLWCIPGRIPTETESAEADKSIAVDLSFVPCITQDNHPSFEESGRVSSVLCWCWHMPGGKKEYQGIVGVVSWEITITKYVNKLRKTGLDVRREQVLFRMPEPAAVQQASPTESVDAVPEVPAETISEPEILTPDCQQDETPAPIAETDADQPEEAMQLTVTETTLTVRESKKVERLLPAPPFFAGSVGAKKIGGIMTPYESALERNWAAIRGDQPQVAIEEPAPVSMEERQRWFESITGKRTGVYVPCVAVSYIPPPGAVDVFYDPPAAIDAAAEPVPDAPVSGLTSVRNLPPVSSFWSPLPRDGDYLPELVERTVAMSRDADDTEANNNVERLMDLADEAWIYREAKRITDEALGSLWIVVNGPIEGLAAGEEDHWAWHAMITAVIPMVRQIRYAAVKANS